MHKFITHIGCWILIAMFSTNVYGQSSRQAPNGGEVRKLLQFMEKEIDTCFNLKTSGRYSSYFAIKCTLDKNGNLMKVVSSSFLPKDVKEKLQHIKVLDIDWKKLTNKRGSGESTFILPVCYLRPEMSGGDIRLETSDALFYRPFVFDDTPNADTPDNYVFFDDVKMLKPLTIILGYLGKTGFQ